MSFSSFQNMTAVFQQIIPNDQLNIYLDSAFSSQNKEHRVLIRQHILKTQSNDIKTEDDKKSILNLDTLPCLSSLFISISHNQKIGGYVTCTRPIGFDLELVDRIQMKAIDRISSQEDILSCPNFKYLWGVKEACFKLVSQNPNIFSSISSLSEIETISWVELGFNQHQFFTTYKSKKITGLVLFDDDILFVVSVSI